MQNQQLVGQVLTVLLDYRLIEHATTQAAPSVQIPCLAELAFFIIIIIIIWLAL